MSLLPKVKLKSAVNFPANVNGGTAIDVTKDRGVYTIDMDYSELAQQVSIPPTVVGSTFLALWEQTQNTYRRMSVADLQMAIAGGGGGQEVSVKTFGASGSGQITTGTIAAGSNELSLASAIDFKNGQGILVYGAGAAPVVGEPVPVAFTVVNASPGATVMNYAIASLDNSGGISTVAGAGINSVTLAELGQYQAGTAGIKMNQLTWSLGAGSPMATVIWRKVNSGPYQLLGCFIGTSIFDSGLPEVSIPGIPASPAASNGWLAAAITTGGGTSSLTLSAVAGSSVTDSRVQHDDTMAINVAMAAGAAISFPAGTYNVRSLAIPASVKSVIGVGNGGSVVVSYAPTSDGLLSGVSAPMGSSPFMLSGMKIIAGNPAAYKGFVLQNAVNSVLFGNEFAGSTALMLYTCTKTLVSGNQITGWFDQAIATYAGTDILINDNLVGAITAQIGAVGLTTTPIGSGYPWGTGINSLGSVGTHISSNILTQYGGSFGISLQNPGGVAENNVIKHTGREAIVAQGEFKVSGNYCYWKPAGNGNQCCYDLGMSIADDGVTNISIGHVSDNTFVNSGFSAIAVFGSGPSTIQNVSIGGNTIIGSNQINAYNFGITLLGSNVSKIIVDTNTFVAPGPHMTHAVGEMNNGSGMPSSNTFYTQLGSRGSSGLMLSVNGANTVYADDLGAFQSYAPAVSTTQSTGSVVVTSNGRFQVHGKRVFLSLLIGFSGTFTGGTVVNVALPFPASTGLHWAFLGREVNATGALWQAIVASGSSVLSPFVYTGSNSITSGWGLSLTGWYERA